MTTILELLTSETTTSDNGVIYLSERGVPSDFEELYIKVREKEGRIYSDTVVKNLPDLKRSNPFYQEWQIRSKSSEKLESYLMQKSKPLMILDLGCGNGWLSNRLAQVPDCNVYAVDLNKLELEQGARIFSKRASLHFIYGNIFDSIFPENGFDIILLASSIQYFSDIQKLIGRLLGLLKEHGEIHITDSPIYTEKSAIEARQSSIGYYQELGYPEMASYYYQHRWPDLVRFHYQIKYDPTSYLRRVQRGFLKKIVSPFPWIVIQR